MTENFQYHRSFLEKKKKTLNCSDVFYREAFGPMYLIDFLQFNKVIDDFLPKNDLVHFQNVLLRSNFSWYYLDTVATLTDPDKSHYYFVNCLYDKGLPVSPSFDHLINPIIESLKKNGIYYI